MTEPLRHFIMGLPAAGKTTFLAALWHVVESQEIDTALVLDSFHGDQGYLHKIRSAWADSNELDRTKISHEQYVSMQLREPNSTAVTELVFPDLSGESFRSQWRDRQMETNYATLLSQASGGLLFVHPKKIHIETLIPEINPMITRLAKKNSKSGDTIISKEKAIPQDSSPETEEQSTKVQTVSWNPDKSPTQIQLVDLTQFAVQLCLKHHESVKIGVVISAWDCIDEKQVDPSAWVERNLPLLWQYLKANDEINVRYFGISAQGGNLEDADEIRELSRISGKCSDRIRVVEEGLSESHDITIPIRWLIGAKS